MTAHAVTSTTTAADLKRMVTIRTVLVDAGARLRGRARADCPLCKGSSIGTISFRRDVWRCHRCQAGGDIFTLVMTIHQCDFRRALAIVSDLAGMPLGTTSRNELAKRKLDRDRVDAAANSYLQRERELRLTIRGTIHAIEKIQRRHGLDSVAAAQCDLVLRPASAAYTLLAFGRQVDRVAFVLGSATTRATMVADIMRAGYVLCESGVQEIVA